MARGLLRGVPALAAGYIVLVGLFMLFENEFIFFPSVHPQGDWDAASRSGTPYEEVWLTTKDNVQIHGWWFPASTPTQETILFLHGNAGNLTGRFPWMRALTTLPANVLIIDYRGYGRSEGTPHEEGVYRDAEAAWEHLTSERGIEPSHLILYGNSLGGGVAAALATRRVCGALILASTFTSVPDMAHRQLPFIPRALVRTQMNTHDRLTEIQVPVLIIHSRGDSMIPVAMAHRNFEAANQPKQLLEVDGADHNEVTYRHQARILDGIRSFLHDARVN
jgi:pimeloyl-ACP methyl ester carboxylesterase